MRVVGTKEGEKPRIVHRIKQDRRLKKTHFFIFISDPSLTRLRCPKTEDRRTDSYAEVAEPQTHEHSNTTPQAMPPYHLPL